MTAIRLGIIVGSLRKAAFSRAVAKALAERAPAGWTHSYIGIGDLALYDQDIEDTPPAPWSRFRDSVRTADALLIVTPEYNRSIPGALKNAIDVGSRPSGQNVFDGKPVAIASQSPAPGGGSAANLALRQPALALNMLVMQQPEGYFREVAKLVDADGKVLSEDGDRLLQRFMDGFAGWVERLGVTTA